MPLASRLVPDAGEPELLAVLRRLPHFADLTPGLLSLVAARARRRTASRGEVLFRTGEPGDEFYLIIGGADTGADGPRGGGRGRARGWRVVRRDGAHHRRAALRHRGGGRCDRPRCAGAHRLPGAGGAGPCARPRAESHLEPPPPQPPAASKATG